VRLKVDQVAEAGKVAGRLYAIGTIGSLTGTFLAALLLIPVVGTHRTFLLFALTLALAALPGLGRLWIPGAVVAVVIAALLLVPVGVTKGASSDGKVIWEKETEYQYARVLEDTTGRRILELNEGQAIHSIYRPGEYLTNGYWDAQLALLWAGRQQLRSVAILGNAGGTTARAVGHYSPTTRIDAVEIDPEVTEVGRELFDMKAPLLHTYDADARPWLRTHPRRQDAIVIDAYRQPYIPFYLTTVEFFRMVRDRLAPGGVAVVNVGHPEGSTKLHKALAATMRAAFGSDRVFRDDSEPTNTMLLATTTDADPTSSLHAAAVTVPGELATTLDEAADRLRPALRGGPVYTDDRAPVEWLVDLSLADVATGKGG
jgi:spermidine synthase